MDTDYDRQYRKHEDHIKVKENIYLSYYLEKNIIVYSQELNI
jgi:hypothetical protein